MLIAYTMVRARAALDFRPGLPGSVSPVPAQ
jgi:hypothetical protein